MPPFPLEGHSGITKYIDYIKCALCLLIDPSYIFKSALNASAPTDYREDFHVLSMFVLSPIESHA